MIVPYDLQLTLRFPVGESLVIATLQFRRGEDSEDVLRAFFVKEDIPVYLENSILSAVQSLLTDDQLLFDDFETAIQSNTLKDNAEQLCRWFGSTTKDWYVQERVAFLTLSNIQHTLLSESSIKEKFRKGFHSICNDSIPDCEKVIAAVALQRKRMNKLLRERKEELEAMHSIQSREMNKAMGSDQANISSLVERHVTELDELEHQYREKVDALKRHQKLKFNEFILKMSSKEPTEYSLVDAEGSTPKSERSWSTKLFGFRDAEEEEPEEPTPTFNWQTAFFTVSIGILQPTLYSIEIHAAPPASLVRRSMYDRKALLKGYGSLYDERLSALVVVTDPSAIHESKTEVELLELCESSVENHFSSMTEQLDEIQKSISKPFETGDFFITKHSNIGDVQLLFHFIGIDTKASPITEKSLTCDINSDLFRGLRNIFEVALSYDVSTLTLPVLLLDTIPEHLISHPCCISRALSVLMAVRCLIQCSTANALKTVRFTLPNVSAEIFEKYKAALKNVFSIQQ